MYVSLHIFVTLFIDLSIMPQRPLISLNLEMKDASRKSICVLKCPMNPLDKETGEGIKLHIICTSTKTLWVQQTYMAHRLDKRFQLMGSCLKPSATATGMGLYPWCTTFCRLESQQTLNGICNSPGHKSLWFYKNDTGLHTIIPLTSLVVVILLSAGNASCWAETKKQLG